MTHSNRLIAFTLALALLALGNAVLIESASAQARPPPAGSAARSAKKPATTAASATTTRPGRPPSVYRSAPTQRHAVANQARVTQRAAGGRSASGDTRRHGVNLGSTSPLNWATWNRATRPATAAAAPQRTRQARSGRTVTFREHHRSTAASASSVRPGRPPSVYRSAPTQRRAVANQARATQRTTSGRAAVGDGRRNAVNLGTASPVSTWSGWNRAVSVLAPAATPSRTRQSGGRHVTFREARARVEPRASVELPRLRRDASGNLIVP